MEGRDFIAEEYAASLIERDRLLSVPVQERAEALHKSEKLFLIIEDHAAEIRASIGTEIQDQRRMAWNQLVIDRDDKSWRTGKYIYELIDAFVGHTFALSEDKAALEDAMMKKVTEDIKSRNESAIDFLRIYPSIDTLVHDAIAKTRRAGK